MSALYLSVYGIAPEVVLLYEFGICREFLSTRADRRQGACQVINPDVVVPFCRSHAEGSFSELPWANKFLVGRQRMRKRFFSDKQPAVTVSFSPWRAI